MRSSVLSLVALSVTFAFSAVAAPLTYFGEDLNGNPTVRVLFPNSLAARAQFLAQVGSSSTDSLEELMSGTLAPITLTFSGRTAQVTGGNPKVASQPAGQTDFFGEYPTSGTNYIASDANFALNIAFSAPVTSFGFYGIDIGDFAAAQLNVTFTNAAGSVSEPVNDTIGNGRSSTPDGSVLFFGYVNTANPFTSVQILSPSDSFAIDDPVIGIALVTSVPEPGSFAAFGTGFLLIALKLRNHRKDRA